MKEIKEIMNGKIKIFNMRIEGETIGFDTPYNSNWNFMPRDFEQIIDTLQQENARLKDKIDMAIKYYETNQQECVIGRNKDDKLIKEYYLPAQCSKKMLDILK